MSSSIGYSVSLCINRFLNKIETIIIIPDKYRFRFIYRFLQSYLCIWN